MSIADRFENVPDVTLVRTYDEHTARRQFQTSVVLIVVLAVTAFMLGLLVRSDQPVPLTRPAPPKVETPIMQKSRVGRMAVAEARVPSVHWTIGAY